MQTQEKLRKDDKARNHKYITQNMVFAKSSSFPSSETRNDASGV